LLQLRDDDELKSIGRAIGFVLLLQKANLVWVILGAGIINMTESVNAYEDAGSNSVLAGEHLFNSLGAIAFRTLQRRAKCPVQMSCGATPKAREMPKRTV